VCHDGHCADNCAVNLKFNTSIGCEYWAVDLGNAIEEGENGELLDAQNAAYSPLGDLMTSLGMVGANASLKKPKVIT